MNESRVARDQSDALVIETLALSEAELRARIGDLERERDTYRFWFKETLHALAAMTAKYERRHEDQQRLQAEVQDLRAIVVAESYDDAAAVMATEIPRRPARQIEAVQ